MKRTRKPTWEPLSGVPGVSDEAVYDENTRVTRAETREPVYPDQYLYVEECCSGQQWIRPLRASAKLDLTAQVLAQTVETLQWRAPESEWDAGDGLEGFTGHGIPCSGRESRP